MTRRRVGGVIDANGLALLAGVTDEYEARANLNRPALPAIRREALRLLCAGLSARDVATALRLSETQVSEWAAESERA